MAEIGTRVRRSAEPEDVDSSGLSSPPTSDEEEPRPPVKKARRESDLSSGRVLRSRGKNKL
jgi:hypothetical protein